MFPHWEMPPVSRLSTHWQHWHKCTAAVGYSQSKTAGTRFPKMPPWLQNPLMKWETCSAVPLELKDLILLSSHIRLAQPPTTQHFAMSPGETGDLASGTHLRICSFPNTIEKAAQVEQQEMQNCRCFPTPASAILPLMVPAAPQLPKMQQSCKWWEHEASPTSPGVSEDTIEVHEDIKMPISPYSLYFHNTDIPVTVCVTIP